ncbi:MAG: sulfatase-like hydrolase/transferase [Proteobacteria bacterium]|nr:sulfatase-like hydrolase/transferase [Pseudomonadota bacterium]
MPFLSARLRLSRTAALVLGAAVFCGTFLIAPMAEGTGLEAAFAASILCALVLLAISLSGRPAFGLVAGSLPMLLLEIAAKLKFRYLATPLLAPDLFYYFNWQTVETLIQYPFLSGAIVAALVLVPLLLVIVWRSDRPPPRNRRMRAARAAGTLAAACAVLVAMNVHGPFAQVHAKGMWLAMNDDSFVSDFLISFRSTHVVEPGFNIGDAARFDWNGDTDPPTSRQIKPDIVAVLEESTFDPRMLTGCSLPRLCDYRLFHADANTLAHGWLEVHTWGGGTWTTEFAFLTGLAHDQFGPAGIYAPFNLAPRIRFTLPRMLRADGYRTVAIYPTEGDFLNGRDAYADYGFDAFYGGEQVGLDWHSTDADLMRVFRRVFAIEKARAHGAPVFLFMLTLHQHGPHMTPLSGLPAPYDKPLFPGKLAKDKLLDDWLNLNLANYLQRLSMSSTAEAGLESLLREDDRPALLLHFGDHQPSFDGAITALQKQLPPQIRNPQVVTYYMLKGYGLTSPRRFDYPVLDIAFAASLLLDAADLHKDSYFTANALLRERCHGQYLDCREDALLRSYRAEVFGSLHDLAD